MGVKEVVGGSRVVGSRGGGVRGSRGQEVNRWWGSRGGGV